MDFVKIKDINEYSTQSVNPLKTPDTMYEVYSVPSFVSGKPEYLTGSEIGSTKAIVQKGDVLLCKINPRINRVWIVGEKTDYLSIASSEWIVIRTSKYNPEYLAWYFRTPRFQKLMESEVTGIGGSLTRAQPKRVAEYPVPICSQDEQNRIVEILNKITKAIANRKEQLKHLDELVKSRFIEMFGDPVKNEKGYPVAKMSDIAEYYNGLTYKPENVSDEGTVVLRSSNIQNSNLDFSDTVRVNSIIRERLMVQENDILMCSRNGSARLVGKVALIKKIEEPMTFGAFMMIIRSRYYAYLMTYFQLDAFRRQITTGATTTINQITGRMMDQITVPVPDDKTLHEFEQFLQQVDKQKVILQQSLTELETQFQALMQEAFKA